MERKTIIFYLIVVPIVIGLLVAIVLVLRARSAPSDTPLGGTGTSAQHVIKGKPLEQQPSSPAYKAGDPVPPSVDADSDRVPGANDGFINQ